MVVVRNFRFSVLQFASLCAFTGIGGPVPDVSVDRVWSPLSVPFKCIGAIHPRNSSEIKASNWTIGCEGLDRDFDRFEKFREYIVPLGIKTIRLQAGWAKTEKGPGKYNFAWLDDIVDYACANGINVLLETGYGNPIYDGGGGHYLGGSFPASETALAAWDRWVDEMSRRYKGKVRDWAMWNEPDLEWSGCQTVSATRSRKNPRRTLPRSTSARQRS